jgi:tetratricopeptide (TPR) repeat protein
LKTTEKAASILSEKIAADLYYHYAEIERARGNNEEARTNYQIALQLEPDHQASRDALRTLPPAIPKAKKPAVPEPSPAPQTIPSPQPGLTA